MNEISPILLAVSLHCIVGGSLFHPNSSTFFIMYFLFTDVNITIPSSLIEMDLEKVYLFTMDAYMDHWKEITLIDLISAESYFSPLVVELLYC